MPILKFFSKKVIFVIIFLILIFLIWIISYSISPSDFPSRKIVSIKSGQYLSQVAEDFQNKKLIKSVFLFKVYVTILSGHKQVQAGDYLFDKPESSLKIAERVIKGEQGLPKYKVTIVEGMTAKQIGLLIKKSIPDFDSDTFFVLAKPYEGYLFPDTYYIYENATPQFVVDQLRNTFKDKIKTQLLAIQALGKELKDVIIMASIVEKEAVKMEDRKIIAGILWKRLEVGMPLQVDPPFYYTLGKDSLSLTTSDLRTDTPYNTYTNKGLPPTPIGNPGLSAIEATVNPTKSKYFFYLSDKSGAMHYAIDHDGHVANKNKYIR